MEYSTQKAIKSNQDQIPKRPSMEKGTRMKRSRDAIISIILDICMNGASKTKIVYQANLNFRTVIPYIELMLKNGLIEPAPESSKVYKTTPKGIKLLQEFRSIQDLLPDLYQLPAKDS